MKTTKIEWTDKTWNPITGCTKISLGCVNCYAELMSNRLYSMGQEKYKNNFKLTLHEKYLDEPFHWKKKHIIFVCSMSDIFHKDVSFEFIDKIFDTINKTPQHNYQILTKRADRMGEYFSSRNIPNNVWLGVTVESEKVKNRIDYLRPLNAKVKFVSCEPLIESLGDLNLTNIDWVIVGGESGTKARKMQEEWIFEIKNSCDKYNSAFFFKQWGTWGKDGIKRNKKENGKILDGKIYQQMPV